MTKKKNQTSTNGVNPRKSQSSLSENAERFDTIACFILRECNSFRISKPPGNAFKYDSRISVWIEIYVCAISGYSSSVNFLFIRTSNSPRSVNDWSSFFSWLYYTYDGSKKRKVILNSVDITHRYLFRSFSNTVMFQGTTWTLNN